MSSLGEAQELRTGQAHELATKGVRELRQDGVRELGTDGAHELRTESTQLTVEDRGAGSSWNHAPKRLWKRLSVHLRPDLHAAADRNGENFMLLFNNVLASKYGLPPCTNDTARKMRRLERLQRSAATIEHEIAALSTELQDDRLVPELRAELEGQREEMIARRGAESQAAARAASRSAAVRDALDAIVGGDPTDRYRRMLPENDTLGDRVDDWDALVALVSCRCGTDVDSAEVAAELRRRCAAGRADAGG